MLYFVMLSAFPCSDANNRCESGSAQKEIAQNHKHDQDTDDSCSPFCYCNCCNISVAYYNFKSLAINHPKVAFVAKKIALRNFTLISNYYGSIWHPPKVTV